MNVSSNLEATFLEGHPEERGYKDTHSTKARGPRGARRARGARISRGPRLSISATRSRGTLGRKKTGTNVKQCSCRSHLSTGCP